MIIIGLERTLVVGFSYVQLSIPAAWLSSAGEEGSLLRHSHRAGGNAQGKTSKYFGYHVSCTDAGAF